MASTRYRALLPAAALRSAGVAAEVIDVTAVATQEGAAVLRAADTVILQKLLPEPGGDFTDAVALRKTIAGLVGPQARLALDINDDHFAQRQFAAFYQSMVPRADGWIASTEHLAKRMRSVLQVEAVVVPDCFEGAPGTPRAPLGRVARGLRQLLDRMIPVPQPLAELAVLWFGHPTNLPALRAAGRELQRAAQAAPIDLLCITAIDDRVKAFEAEFNRDHGPRIRARFIQWTPESMRAGLEGCDLVVVPAELQRPGALAKSANRLLEALVAGRFAVCTPVPSYLEFQDYAWIGERLDEGIRWALENPVRAARRARDGQRYALEHFSAARIAARWREALEDIRPGTRPAASLPAAGGELRLNIGCGDKILPGYVNVDTVASRAGAKPDVICDIRDLHPFADASAEEVLSVHVVEHFPAWEIEQVLREWIRVLRPGGRLVVECPNVVYACEQIAQQPAEASKTWAQSSHLMWVLYGDPRWRDPLMAHWWGYTPESLCELLRSVGLADVRQDPAQFKRREPRDMRVVGIKAGAVGTVASAPAIMERPIRPAAATAAAGSVGEQYLK
ncbi:MAG: methyltransferase domain-containing protein [Pseudomonadota bacterium]